MRTQSLQQNPRFCRSVVAFDKEILNKATTAIMEDRFLQLPLFPHEVRNLVATPLHAIQEKLLKKSVTARHPLRETHLEHRMKIGDLYMEAMFLKVEYICSSYVEGYSQEKSIIFVNEKKYSTSVWMQHIDTSHNCSVA
jgi:hypothetical protein